MQPGDPLGPAEAVTATLDDALDSVTGDGDDVGACYRVVSPYKKKTLSRNA